MIKKTEQEKKLKRVQQDPGLWRVSGFSASDIGAANVCCQRGLSLWLVSANGLVTQGLSEVQSSGRRRLPCSQTQLETEAGVFEATFNMILEEIKCTQLFGQLCYRLQWILPNTELPF